MSELLPNYVTGTWTQGAGPGIDVERAFSFARKTGGPALRALSYEQRAKALTACVGVLKQNRDRYLNLSLENYGTTAADSMIDVDGAIFTLYTFAKAGQALGQAPLSGRTETGYG